MLKLTLLSSVLLASVMNLSATAQSCDPIEFTIYFDTDSAKLSPAGEEVIANASERALNARCDIDWIELIGHTDTSEGMDEAHAEQLSDARVKAVNEGLAANEVPRILFYFDTDEDKNPAIATGAGIKEPLNRRVAVTIRFKG